MRVLFVSSSSGSRGGGEFFLVYLAKALKAEGVEVGLWLSSDPQMDGIVELFGDTGPVFRQPYVNTYLRRTRSLSHLLPAGRRLAPIVEQWRSFQPDILHLNKQCLEDGLDLLEAARRLDLPQGCTLHITQTAVELKAALGRARDVIARRALQRYPGGLWAIAENRARALRSFLGDKRDIGCIPNGVRIPAEEEIHRTADEVRRQHPDLVEARGPVAVSVGRLEPQKDPFRFLDVVKAWKAREPALSALWVGDGRMRDAFEERIRAMGAEDWIHCLGWQEDATAFLCLADVYVHPARFEGLPFALLEAMARGLPCVISTELAADLKDIPEELWIPLGEDVIPLVEHLSDRAFLDGKGRKAREVAIRQFSLEAMARAYLALYEGLLEERKGGKR
jgi:glycosyltransferase involved in cell wall biosynthesis